MKLLLQSSVNLYLNFNIFYYTTSFLEISLISQWNTKQYFSFINHRKMLRIAEPNIYIESRLQAKLSVKASQ